MELSDRFGIETQQRTELAKRGYEWSLAVVHLSYVSDGERLIFDLKEHVKKYDGHFPPDVVMQGETADEIYILMRGSEANALGTLDMFFDDLGRKNGKSLVLKARFGVSQYRAGATAEDLIDTAKTRPLRYEIGDLPQFVSRIAAQEISHVG